MVRRLTLIALAAAVAACGRESAPETPEAGPALSASARATLDRYQDQARDFAAAIVENAGAADELAAHADELLASAEAVLPEFVAARPHCETYLSESMRLRKLWTAMTPEQIEAGYHKDGALPAVDDAASCYHMKDLIVHPLTALAFLSQDPPDAAAARREIDEVIAHVTVVRDMR